MLQLREGRSIDDVKEAINLLVLVCRDNEDELGEYEEPLLAMEGVVQGHD